MSTPHQPPTSLDENLLFWGHIQDVLTIFVHLPIRFSVKCFSDLFASKSLAYSSPPLAFCAANDWAATDTPGTVCDWRKEVTREALVVTTLGLPLLMIGLLGGMGGGTRAEFAAPNWLFLTGGCGGWLPWCCTLWARIIVATFEPAVMALELSCLSTCPGDIDRAMPVATKKRN